MRLGVGSTIIIFPRAPGLRHLRAGEGNRSGGGANRVAVGWPPPPALLPTGPVVGHPSRPRRLHAPFHQAIQSGGEILLRAAGRPASATRWPAGSERPTSVAGKATTARRGFLPRQAPSGLRRPVSRHGNSACRLRATLAEAAGSLGRRRPGKPRRDPCRPSLHGS